MEGPIVDVESAVVTEAGVVVTASGCKCTQYEVSHLVQEEQVRTP